MRAGPGAAPAEQSYFTRESFRFLRELARNNDREWFNSNKLRYEEDVRDPAVRFVVAFSSDLKAVSPHFRADPRANGGSIFRIYRDVRFAKDKSPFKIHTGIQFRHDQGKDVHAPGFYLHLEPGGCFGAMGIWHPDGKSLRKLREAIVERPDRWRAEVTSHTFTERLALSGDRLSRAPRGFDPDHPLVEDLKWKDFVAVADLTEDQVVEPGFLEDYASLCRAGAGFMAFLCEALELPF